MGLRDDQIRRYSRHVLLPEVGGIGQQRLLDAAVRVPALNAAGQAAVLYLAAAGVGKIVVDLPGKVVSSGPLFLVSDVGQPFRDAVATRVAALNPDCQVVAAAERAVELRVGKPLDDGVEALWYGASAARSAVQEILA
jgi:molybdopterin-synthase adenylyltransferase